MLREVLDTLKIDQVDLIGNDSGGGIAQNFCGAQSRAGANVDPHQLRRS